MQRARSNLSLAEKGQDLAGVISFLLLLIILLLTLSACQSPAPTAMPPTPSPWPSPVASLTPISIRQPSPTPPPSAIPNSPYPAPQSSFENQKSEIYNLLFSVPIAPDGVQYRGVGVTDSEITGPNALAVLPDGSFIIADLIGNRLLHYSTSGTLLKAFELSSIDVANISDLVAHGPELYLLEVSFNASPPRCRVNRLGPGEAGSWNLLQRYDVLLDFCSEGGLSGIFVDQAGRLLLEIAGGSQVYLLADTNQAPALTPFPTSSAPPPAPQPADGYSYYGRLYRVENGQPGENPRYQAGDVTVQTALSHGLGGFRFLEAFPDGRSYLIRNDVVNDKTIQVDQTVSLIGPDGVQLGVARFPVSESLYYVYRNLAAGPDGAVYGLLPREKTLDVIRLNFFSNLPPLIPTAAEPVISVVSIP